MCNPCAFHTKHTKEIEEEKKSLFLDFHIFLICKDLIFILSTSSAAPFCVFGEGDCKIDGPADFPSCTSGFYIFYSHDSCFGVKYVYLIEFALS